MCGILACLGVNREITVNTVQRLEQSLKEVHHRGPDNSSSLLITGPSYKVFLGHNRLSIIDLAEHSNQPFNIDNKYYIIFNGEIYNYLEIREDLLKKGYSFKTRSDTEVLLKLYIESGTSRFSELNGMWTFMIIDLQQDRAIISRDRFGEKPLYTYKDYNGLLFVSSEIKQLLPFVDQRKINFSTMSNYLHHFLLDSGNDTFFEGVEKVPAKTCSTIDLISGGKVTEQYWDYSHLDLDDISDDEAIDRYRTLFIDSIRLRLRSDVKIGNTLSGGLDSSSIAVVADDINGGQFFNYSVVNRNKKFSEERFVDLLVAENDIKVSKVHFEEIDPWAIVEKVIWHHDEPILSFSTVAHFVMLQKLKEESDITVVLSGQGGDEGLAGYNKYYFYYLMSLAKDQKYYRFVKECIHLLPRFKGEFSWHAGRRYLSQSFQGSQRNSLIRLASTASGLNDFSDFKERQRLDYDKFSVPALCHYEDRNSMAHSLEMRLPFLDHRLVDFTLSLPESLKIRNGFNKFILRKAVKELPNDIRWRFDKKGFTVDENSKYTRRDIDLKLIPLFKDSALGDFGVINPKAVTIELNSLAAGRSDLWVRDIGRIIFAEKWAKMFL